MRNRKLIWIAGIAVCMAAATAHFRPEPLGHRRPAVSVTTSASAPEKPNSHSSRHPQTQNHSTADQTLAQLRDLFAADPTDQNGNAADLLNDVCRAGQFETALILLDAVPTDMRSDWLKIIFNRWAQSHPQDTMKSLDTLQDPTERAGAFHAAVAGWNSRDPAGLANYAISLSATDDRDYALALALNNWSLQDPVALATWLNTLPRGGEFDLGAALMIAKSDAANRSPELAMKWVENIGDPELRQTSFAHVFAEWLQIDSAAARQYIATATWLDDSFRSKILSASP